MYNVSFGDKSTADFHLVSNDIGRRQFAEEEVERIPIPYRNGELTIHSGTYKSYERPMTFLSTEAGELSQIGSWLTGMGELRTEKDPGGYFLASVIGPVQITPYMRDMDQIVVTFLVEPFFFLESGKDMLNLGKDDDIYNPGTMDAEPVIKVYGSGDITLNVNSDFVNLKGVSGPITMDSRLKLCYEDLLPAGKKMVGDYLKLRPGWNHIQATGNVSRIEILPRWCER